MYDRIPRLQSNKKMMLKLAVMMKITVLKPMMSAVFYRAVRAKVLLRLILLLTMAHIGAHIGMFVVPVGAPKRKIQAAEQWSENIETGQRFAV